MSDANPCLDCGACCAHFRVSFYWGEGDDAPGGCVPVGFTEPLNLHLRYMKGTGVAPRRCVALVGEPGRQVACSIYASRPTPCRDFPAFLADGLPNPKCNALRAALGLTMLATPEAAHCDTVDVRAA